jgi:hypothetical protein
MPTHKEILEAISKSIEKWENIVAGHSKDCGPTDCPLCKLFNRKEQTHDYCTDCPVLTYGNGDKFCQNTPYSKWETLFGMTEPMIAKTPTQKQAAQDELDFLKEVERKLSPSQ